MITFLTWSPSGVYCEQSKTGGEKALGMRLVCLRIEIIVRKELKQYSHLCSKTNLTTAQMPSFSISSSCVIIIENFTLVYSTGWTSADSRKRTSSSFSLTWDCSLIPKLAHGGREGSGLITPQLVPSSGQYLVSFWLFPWCMGSKHKASHSIHLSRLCPYMNGKAKMGLWWGR